MSSPSVSVVIPAYGSHHTIRACLASLEKQTFRDFETIVVDSSPGPESEEIVRTAFPDVVFLRSTSRLLPHAARNRGAACAAGGILVFSDPDVTFDPRWLERMVGAHRHTGDTISGAIDCAGDRWLDRGIHLCKFSKWLSGLPSSRTDCAPTANLLVARSLYDAIGGFRDDQFLGDLTFSWEATKRGATLRFEPGAVVFHHHRHDTATFLRERFERGLLFADARTEWHGNRKSTALLYLLATGLPIRWPWNVALVISHAWRAGRLRADWTALPVAVAGYSASFAGECLGYARFLLGRDPVSASQAARTSRSSAP